MRSRSMPQWACMSAKEASLQIAPMSPKWFASRSISAMRARSQTARAGGSISQRRLGGAGEGVGVGDGRVARDAPGKARALREVRARHQALDALMHIAEPLLETDHGLAVGGEAEMAGLDDAGVHRPDRDLMQARTFRPAGKYRARRRPESATAAPSGCRHAPAAVVEPAAGIRRA